MAEEEKNEQQTDAEQPQDEATPAAEEAPAEEPAAAEEPAPAAAEPAPAEAEEGEQLSPRMARRMERSRATGPAQPPRSPEQRAAERAAERAGKAQARSRWRKKRRGRDAARRSAAGPQDAVPSAAAEPGKRKIRQGIVVSSKPDRTITVRIDRVGRHRVYGKVVRGTTTLHAHDERNEANEGDVVRVVESRPLSRLKRWRLVEILEKAK
jgi:small subunit ribosomal protein S17